MVILSFLFPFHQVKKSRQNHGLAIFVPKENRKFMTLTQNTLDMSNGLTRKTCTRNFARIAGKVLEKCKIITSTITWTSNANGALFRNDLIAKNVNVDFLASKTFTITYFSSIVTNVKQTLIPNQMWICSHVKFVPKFSVTSLQLSNTNKEGTYWMPAISRKKFPTWKSRKPTKMNQTCGNHWRT